MFRRVISAYRAQYTVPLQTRRIAFSTPYSAPGRSIRPMPRHYGVYIRTLSRKRSYSGASHQHSCDTWIEADTRRIAALEHLDEIEELRLVLSHYCVAWATRGQISTLR